MTTKAKKVKLTAEQLRAEEAQVTREANAYLAEPNLAKANAMLFGPDASAGKPDPVAEFNARIEEAKRVAGLQREAAEARDALVRASKPVKELDSDDLDAVQDAQQTRRVAAIYGKQDAAHSHEGADLRGQLTDYVGLVKFISAGNAILTVKSRKSGERLTFKFSRPKDEAATGRVKPIFVALLSGPNNDSDYQFLGTIFPEASNFTYKVSAKSRVSYTAPSQEFVRWFVKQLNMSPENIFARAEIWHEGRCGRCGRRLTVPESVESGFGPECINHV
jgi:hypothetical protein